MTISRKEAEEALALVEDARQSLGILSGYRHSAPYFYLWGAVWFVAYLVCDFMPQQMGNIWLVADVIGIGATVVLSLRGPRKRGRYDWRWIGGMAAVFFFMAACLSILPPKDGRAFTGFITLVFGLLYMLTGLWAGFRLSLAGVMLTVVTLVGYALVKDHYYAWLGVAGGGTLFVTGLWLRRA